MVPNIDGTIIIIIIVNTMTQNKKQNTSNGAQYDIQYPTNINPAQPLQ